MPDFLTADRRYYLVEQGDGNTVVYETHGRPDGWTPVWDRWSWEAGRGDAPSPPSPPEPPPSGPVSPLPASPDPGRWPSGGLRVLQVTNARDGGYAPRIYSYWSNAWVTGNRVFVFAGHVSGKPHFFDVNLATGSVDRFEARVPYRGTTEGWSWDAQGWIYLIEGPRLRHVNPFSGQDDVVFDISDSHPGCILWQSHSSDGGQVHSATVKRIVNDGAYPAIGTIVWRLGHEDYFPAQGDLDESQIDPTGTFLIIKEYDDNRVINLATRDTQILRDADGAVGHSDCGPLMLVGEDNIHGACVRWDLNAPLTPGRRIELLETWNLGHVSIRGGRCLRSYNGGLSLIALDGSGEQPLVSLDVPDDYDHQLKANLDPSGRVACYLLDTGGQFDVFLAVLPS